MEAGADVNAKDEFSTAFRTAQKKHMGSFDGKSLVLRYLLLLPWMGWIKYLRVFCSNLFDLFSVIFMRDDDFSDRLHRSANFTGFTPLHYAVLADSLECVRILVNAGESRC